MTGLEVGTEGRREKEEQTGVGLDRFLDWLSSECTCHVKYTNGKLKSAESVRIGSDQEGN